MAVSKQSVIQKVEIMPQIGSITKIKNGHHDIFRHRIEESETFCIAFIKTEEADGG